MYHKLVVTRSPRGVVPVRGERCASWRIHVYQSYNDSKAKRVREFLDQDPGDEAEEEAEDPNTLNPSLKAIKEAAADAARYGPRRERPVNLVMQEAYTTKLLPKGYIGPLVAMRHQGRGYGILTRESVQAGQLLLVSVPVSYLESFTGALPTAASFAQHMMTSRFTDLERELLELLYCGRKRSQKDAPPNLRAMLRRKPKNQAPQESGVASSEGPPTATPMGESGSPQRLGRQHVEEMIHYNAYGDFHQDRVVAACRQQANRPHVGLWPEFSLLNHSCVPNAIHLVVGNRMVVRAVRDIPAGKEVTINYLGRSCLEPLTVRRSELESVYGFNCRCPRCVAEDLFGLPLSTMVEEIVSNVVAALPRISAVVAAGDREELLRIEGDLLGFKKGFHEECERQEVDPQTWPWAQAGVYDLYELLAQVRQAQEPSAFKTMQAWAECISVVDATLPGCDLHSITSSKFLNQVRARYGPKNPRTAEAQQMCYKAHLMRYGPVDKDVMKVLVASSIKCGEEMDQEYWAAGREDILRVNEEDGPDGEVLREGNNRVQSDMGRESTSAMRLREDDGKVNGRVRPPLEKTWVGMKAVGPDKRGAEDAGTPAAHVEEFSAAIGSPKDSERNNSAGLVHGMVGQVRRDGAPGEVQGGQPASWANNVLRAEAQGTSREPAGARDMPKISPEPGDAHLLRRQGKERGRLVGADHVHPGRVVPNNDQLSASTVGRVGRSRVSKGALGDQTTAGWTPGGGRMEERDSNSQSGASMYGWNGPAVDDKNRGRRFGQNLSHESDLGPSGLTGHPGSDEDLEANAPPGMDLSVDDLLYLQQLAMEDEGLMAEYLQHLGDSWGLPPEEVAEQLSEVMAEMYSNGELSWGDEQLVPERPAVRGPVSGGNRWDQQVEEALRQAQGAPSGGAVGGTAIQEDVVVKSGRRRRK